MIATDSNTTAEFAVALLIHYSFDLGGYSAEQLIDRWLNDYPANWVRLAVVEALYQGRYKAISVEQILVFWNRRGQAIYHFKHEFERLICSNFPQLGGQADATNVSPSPTESAAYFSNGHDHGAVVKIPPASNKIAKKSVKACHQTSDNDPRWLGNSSASPPPIEQFTPEKTDGSDFYSKLKAIAQSSRYMLAGSAASGLGEVKRQPKALAPAVSEGKPYPKENRTRRLG